MVSSASVATPPVVHATKQVSGVSAPLIVYEIGFPPVQVNADVAQSNMVLDFPISDHELPVDDFALDLPNSSLVLLISKDHLTVFPKGNHFADQGFLSTSKKLPPTSGSSLMKF